MNHEELRAAAERWRRRKSGEAPHRVYDGLFVDYYQDIVRLAEYAVARLAADEPNPPPAWHDAPTGPGLWVSADYWTAYEVFQKDLVPDRANRLGRCYGPIPQPPTDAT